MNYGYKDLQNALSRNFRNVSNKYNAITMAILFVDLLP